MDDAQIKEMVRASYGGIAEAAGDASCCGPATSCCGDMAPGSPPEKSRDMGYSDAELAAVPEGANLGLGCGNPQAIAALRPGEVVLDLGSGAGFDCFLAAQQVGGYGRKDHGGAARRQVHAPPGKGAELEQAMKARCGVSRQDAGCEQFEVFQSVSDPDKLVLLEFWNDQAALDAHAKLQAQRILGTA